MRPSRRSLLTVLAAGLLALPALTGCEGDPAGDPTVNASAKTGPDATAPAAAAFDPCKVLTVADVGAILGGTVTMKETPGGGCQFDQDDPRAPSFGITKAMPADQGGGIASSKLGAEGTIDGKAETLSGVGEAAYVVVGKGMAIPTESVQAAGGVQVKGQLVDVVLAQGSKLPADRVTKMLKDVLALIAANA
ncbi:hypothetical protein AB0M43_03800 [Longispora sp. NPDC051575]|uniref:hypothetical protein n=1 Tax=Longispora sp. NPDC051575 TaxID=3154943 RepID=UPI0034489538